MTATTSAEKPAREQHQRLGTLGKALDWRLDRLQREYLKAVPAARADLARLRRGVGKPAGSVPEIWELTVGAVPEELARDDDDPSWAEQAVHAAMTLYAVHQQSLDIPAHVPGVSFGQAVGRLSAHDDRSKEAVTRRFMAVATAESIDELLTHARGLITQLRAARQGMDYARFADDVWGLLTPAGAQRVRLAWGRSFYRTKPSSSDDSTDESATNDPE